MGVSTRGGVMEAGIETTSNIFSSFFFVDLYNEDSVESSSDFVGKGNAP